MYGQSPIVLPDRFSPLPLPEFASGIKSAGEPGSSGEVWDELPETVPSEPASTTGPNGDVEVPPPESDGLREYLRQYTHSVLIEEATNQTAMRQTEAKAADMERSRVRAGALHTYWDQLTDAVSAEGQLLHQQRQVDYLQRRVEQLEQLEQLRRREAELRALLFPTEPPPTGLPHPDLPDKEA